MASDLLQNIRLRMEKAMEVGKFPDWYITVLMGFKKRYSTDLLIDVPNPKDPSDPKLESIKLVRVEHRLPDNRWIFGGGFRFHPDVTLSQMESHAIEMSMKFWINGVPHGGAKGGAAFDPSNFSERTNIDIISKITSTAVTEKIIGPRIDRWAPDLGTNAETMRWIQDQYSYQMRERGTPESAAAVTGKPLDYGGMPGRKEATGLGLHYAFDTFRDFMTLPIPDVPTAILQGFGNVGMHFALFAKNKFKIVGVADEFGSVYCQNGLDVEKLAAHTTNNPQKSINGFECVQKDCVRTSLEEMLTVLGADVFVPAALEEVITTDLAKKIKVKLILEGANGPTVPEADHILKDRNILVIPDIYANAGGAIVSYFEWYVDTHVEPFDGVLEPPASKDLNLVKNSLYKALRRNGIAIIKLRSELKQTHKDIDYRLTSYIYGMKRLLPFFAIKRRRKI